MATVTEHQCTFHVRGQTAIVRVVYDDVTQLISAIEVAQNADGVVRFRARDEITDVVVEEREVLAHEGLRTFDISALNLLRLAYVSAPAHGLPGSAGFKFPFRVHSSYHP